MIGGAIGLALLWWRSSSLARQTKATLETTKALFEQAKIAARQADVAEKRHYAQTIADREQRITDSFAKAVDQFSSQNLETRLGAIYTLERLAKESEREYWPIMETLSAFVRERAPGLNPYRKEASERSNAGGYRAPATDIQAILTVIGRRDDTIVMKDVAANRCIDLGRTDLRHYDLHEANLQGTLLWLTDLKGAHLQTQPLKAFQ